VAESLAEAFLARGEKKRASTYISVVAALHSSDPAIAQVTRRRKDFGPLVRPDQVRTFDTPLLAKIRTQWKETDTGKASNTVPWDRELEFYWSSMMFSVHLRLEAIARRAREDHSINEAVTKEKSHIEQELHLCSNIVCLLLSEQ